MTQIVLALITDFERFQYLLDRLEQQQSIKVLVFGTVARLQRWLELNPEPSGLIVDFTSPIYQDFLIRFSLRHPDVAVLSLKAQSTEQINLRTLAFTNRLTSPTKLSNPGRILLVDDSKTVQMQYQKVLKAAGYIVELADDAEQGLKKAVNGQFDLAIIDFFMPGDNGAQLCQKLQSTEETYELTCAILTAQYKQQVVDQCIKAGAHECMFKNESYDLFLTRVKALIRSVERKRQIERERGRLIGLLYSVAEGVYGVTPDGRIQFVNPATLNLLGQSMADLMGHYPHDCIHPIDNGGQQTSFEHCFLQQAYILGDELRDWRTLFQRADGSLFPVECSVTLLGDVENNQGSVVVFRDISEQQRLEKNWQWQLNHDHLTGLLNRSAFEEILTRELNRIRRTKDNSLVLFIDLDKFKVINDELGHAAGDQLLVSLSENLKSRARDTDYVARLAGDEFIVLATHVGKSEFAELAEKYRLLLEESNLFWEGKSYAVTGSIGVAVLDENADSIGEIMARADQACQSAKQKGRNQWEIYREQMVNQTEQGNWYHRLTSAMREQQFTLLKQAIFDPQNRERCIALNCSLRLKEGTALISPSIFMSNAKRFGLLEQIDRQVIDMLANYCASNPSLNLSWFSVTLSTETLSNESFRKELLKLWCKSGLTPAHLQFEIAEEGLFNFPRWKTHLANLRTAGFGVIINHFGLNAQSLLNLPQLPVDAIKLDSMLTRELATSIPRRNLIDAIVKTARQSNIKVIATHIESSIELELLLARGIDFVQGFYLDKPEIIGD